MSDLYNFDIDSDKIRFYEIFSKKGEWCDLNIFLRHFDNWYGSKSTVTNNGQIKSYNIINDPHDYGYEIIRTINKEFVDRTIDVIKYEKMFA